jgi:type IV secretion system protein VirD4
MLVRWIANVEGDPNLANLLMASQVLGLSHLGERLKHNQSKINPWTYDAFVKLTSIQGDSGTNRQQMGVIGTAQEVFGPLQSIDLIPVVAQPSNLPRFCPDDPLKVDGKHLIVCIVDKARRSVTTPIIATFMHNICNYNLNGSTSRKTPLAVVVDEADTVRVPQFLNWINQERSNGFCGIFGFQHLGQPPKAYGEEAARGFLSSCATKFWFNPGDFQTAELLSKSLGEKEVVLKTASKSTTKGHVTRSTSETRHKVPLLTPDEILCLPKGKAVIQSPGVGDKDKSGIPYVHQFNYDERLEKEAEAADNALYDQIYQALEEAYQPPPSAYYEDLLKNYLGILDRLLPLPGKNVGESLNEVLTVSGADLIRGLEIAKKSTAGVVPDRRYSVPPEVIEANGEVTLNAENCIKILGEKVYA